jgi:chondroitin AC lyase
MVIDLKRPLSNSLKVAGGQHRGAFEAMRWIYSIIAIFLWNVEPNIRIMKYSLNLLFILTFIILIGTSLISTKDDFLIVRERVVDELMKDKVDDQQVADVLEMMNEDGSFQGINYDDLSRTAGFPHRRHTSNLVDLAKAYKTKSSDYFRSKKLKQRITKSLEYWVDHDFFGDNWHNNQISTPTNLVNLMLIMGDEFPQDLVDGAQPIIGRANMNASGARPSGDRIVIAGILAKNLLFIGDREQFGEIIELIGGEVKFSTGQRGMQHDYSFHHRHDRVNNTTSYGYGKYANAFGEWSYYVANTRYAFSVEKINHLVDYYLDGIYKQLVYGVYTDISVKNRSITHKATFEPRGITEIERLIFSTDYRKDELEEIIQLRKGEAEPSKSFSKFFWQTEHFVVQRPNYYTTVRMFSTRNRNMEVPYNGPGKPTHHRADGTNYIQLDGDEYHNIWPVYDWQKISGTTIMQKPELPPPDQIQKDGLTHFVGAVTDGLYGAVAFDFRSPHDLTAAKKSWFFFDQEYACLGTDIKVDQRLPVVTTVNQVLMKSAVAINQNGEVRQLERGSRQLDNIKWVHQDRIGYVFPEPTTVNISNQTETGRWSDITDQKNISDELVSEEVFTLWFDHGSRPNNASYKYIVVPDVDEEEIEETSNTNRGIEILSNTAELQAVRSDKMGIFQMAFYKSGALDITDDLNLQVDSQGMIMLHLDGGRIEKMTIADPSRRLARMHVTVTGVYDSEGDDHATNHNEETNSTSFVIDLPQGVYAGKSVVIDL